MTLTKENNCFTSKGTCFSLRALLINFKRSREMKKRGFDKIEIKKNTSSFLFVLKKRVYNELVFGRK